MQSEKTPDSGNAATDMKMSPEDFAGLRAQATTIGQNDSLLGRMLHALVLHLGHAHGLDPAVEDARLADIARTDTRAQEDTAVEVATDVRVKARLAQDAQSRTPEQQAVLTASRTAEDAQLTADADALAQRRAEEDAATKDTQGEGGQDYAN